MEFQNGARVVKFYNEAGDGEVIAEFQYVQDAMRFARAAKLEDFLSGSKVGDIKLAVLGQGSCETFQIITPPSGNTE